MSAASYGMAKPNGTAILGWLRILGKSIGRKWMECVRCVEWLTEPLCRVAISLAGDSTTPSAREGIDLKWIFIGLKLQWCNFSVKGIGISASRKLSSTSKQIEWEMWENYSMVSTRKSKDSTVAQLCRRWRVSPKRMAVRHAAEKKHWKRRQCVSNAGSGIITLVQHFARTACFESILDMYLFQDHSSLNFRSDFGPQS